MLPVLELALKVTFVPDAKPRVHSPLAAWAGRVSAQLSRNGQRASEATREQQQRAEAQKLYDRDIQVMHRHIKAVIANDKDVDEVVHQ